MAVRIPEIRPISDLAREARTLVERVRQRQEPIVITQRGRDVAVLVPIELYRRMERLATHRIVSPRLVHPEDAAKFRLNMTVLEPSREDPHAGV
ncbi:MAG: type II toxin-antitoxin system Phd/YefM family antitoxin [Chloroflexi bacterium]|nr:type II toxin-antitoxin system Phd/YefM family antitoxin [Chloroflexota bacterium]